MKRIIITGARGIVGYSILESLKKSNYSIFPIILNNELPYYYPNSFIEKAIKCNIAKKDELNSLLYKIKPNIIIHLAANNDNNIPSNGSHSLFETNIIGTLNILEYCYQNSCRVRLIMTSSIEVLNLKLKLNNVIKEIYKPYEVSKFSAELISQSYIDCYKLPCIILRLGSIYGGGDLNLKRFIPSMIYNYYKNNILPTTINTDTSRNFLYTEDLVEFINLLLADVDSYLGKIYDLYNIEKTDLSYILKKYILFNNNQLNLDPRKNINISNKNVLNWMPTINIDNGLYNTFKWYKQFYNNNI